MIPRPPHITRTEPTTPEERHGADRRAVVDTERSEPVASSRDSATLSRSARRLDEDRPDASALAPRRAARLAEAVAESVADDPEAAQGAHLGALVHRAARRTT